jgi:hypothetical protein
VARAVATETVARTLPADVVAARRAIRAHPRWRRRYAETFAEQVPLADRAARAADLVRLFAEELLDLVDRAHLREYWDASGPSVRSIVAPLAVAVEASLTGRDASAALADATDAVAASRARDRTRFWAIMRRPLQRMITMLGTAPTGSAPTPLSAPSG